jgi:hypothetical protein
MAQQTETVCLQNLLSATVEWFRVGRTVLDAGVLTLSEQLF